MPVPNPLRSGAIFEHIQRSPLDLPTHATPLPLITAQVTITAVQFTFIPDWSQFSDRVRSGMDRSPLEWGITLNVPVVHGFPWHQLIKRHYLISNHDNP